MEKRASVTMVETIENNKKLQVEKEVLAEEIQSLNVEKV
jgi:hypothetical protein